MHPHDQVRNRASSSSPRRHREDKFASREKNEYLVRCYKDRKRDVRRRDSRCRKYDSRSEEEGEREMNHVAVTSTRTIPPNCLSDSVVEWELVGDTEETTASQTQPRRTWWQYLLWWYVWRTE